MKIKEVRASIAYHRMLLAFLHILLFGYGVSTPFSSVVRIHLLRIPSKKPRPKPHLQNSSVFYDEEPQGNTLQFISIPRLQFKYSPSRYSAGTVCLKGTTIKREDGFDIVIVHVGEYSSNALKKTPVHSPHINTTALSDHARTRK